MNFEKLVPNIFYADISDGLKLFVDCLGFTITHNALLSNQPFCVMEMMDCGSIFLKTQNVLKNILFVTKNIEQALTEQPLSLIQNRFIQTLKK